jgi:hypothetical protein
MCHEAGDGLGQVLRKQRSSVQCAGANKDGIIQYAESYNAERVTRFVLKLLRAQREVRWYFRVSHYHGLAAADQHSS